jgi:hypothetical protein
MRGKDWRGRGGQRVNEIERQPGEKHHERKSRHDNAAGRAVIISTILSGSLGRRYCLAHLLDIVHVVILQHASAAIFVKTGSPPSVNDDLGDLKVTFSSPAANGRPQPACAGAKLAVCEVGPVAMSSRRHSLVT